MDTTAAAATVLGVSLPIASTIGALSDLGGTANSSASNEPWAIQGDAANNRALFRTVAVSNANHTIGFNFSYRIL